MTYMVIIYEMFSSCFKKEKETFILNAQIHVLLKQIILLAYDSFLAGSLLVC